MRLLRIYRPYTQYLHQFYAQRPELVTQSYDAQQAVLMEDCYHWANFLSAALRERGYDTDDIAANARPMQQAWAREHNISFSADHWMEEILLAQVKAFCPDVLFVFDWSEQVGPEFVRECRRVAPSIKLVLGWCGEAHPPAAYFREHDLVLSCAPDTAADLNRQGIRAVHLNHAFAPRILSRLQKYSTISLAKNDIGFMGQVLHGDEFHNQRAVLLDSIVAELGIVLYGDVSEVKSFPIAPNVRKRRELYFKLLEQFDRPGVRFVIPYLPKHRAYLDNRDHEKLRRVFARLHEMAKPPAFGLEMFGRLAQLKVSLNTHGPSLFASNMRLYEATGVGTCLLTDWKENLGDLFEPDREVVTYKNVDECVEKARYLLDHERERCTIAAAGQRRTLRDHTFTQRASHLHEIVSAAIAKGPLPILS